MTLLIRFLLLAYPRSLRVDHGAEMAAAVEAQWTARRGLFARTRLLVVLFADFLTSWPREWRAARPRRSDASAPRGPQRGTVIDARAATRMFLREPWFAAGAVVTLALGIGATSAIVALADATILRPLPIRAPERVLQSDLSWSHPDYRDLAATPGTCSETAAWSDQTLGLERNGSAWDVPSAVVSGSYFGLTGVTPRLGRLLNDDDDQPGARPVAVLTERAWRRIAASDPSIVGSTVLLNKRAVTIVGVAPAAFRGLSLSEAPDIFIPIRSLTGIATGLLGRPAAMTNRGLVFLQMVCRLASGATPAQATASINALYRRIDPPEPGQQPDTIVFGLIADRALGFSSADDSRRFIFVLLGATAVSLLLACATVANLLLVRSEQRRRELALRAALGASRARIVWLLLTESLGIGLAGAIAGTVVAELTMRLLESFELPGRVSIGDIGLHLSPELIAATAGLGILTSVIFGLTPAFQASRIDTQSALRDGARGATRQPIRSVLVTAQVALCVLLLAGGLAFGRAMRFATGLDLGFDTTHTSLTTITPARLRYTRDQIADVQRRITEMLRGQPWVAGSGWTSMLPLRGSMTWDLGIDSPLAPKGDISVEANVVSAGYFNAMGIPIRAGRGFSAADTSTVPQVVVVSESMARRYWPDGRAIGALVDTDTGKKDAPRATVIGIAGDVKHNIDKPREVMFYAPLSQQPDMLDFSGQTLVVRTAPGSAAGPSEIVAALKRVDPVLPVKQSQTMSDHLGALLMPQRLGLTLFLLFAGLAVVLTAFGIYAVVAFAVTQRRREIGIRVALGAERRSVLNLVARQGLTPIAAGLIVGLSVFWISSTALTKFLFSLPPATILSLVWLTLFIGALTLGAMLIPARRALSVDPAVALRQE